MTVVTLTSVADAFYENENPNTNYGTSESMFTGENYGNNRRHELVVKFDLSAIQNNAMIVSSAQLKLYDYDDLQQVTARCRPYRLTAAFTEGTVTWNTKPAYDTTSLGYTDIANDYRGDVTIDLPTSLIQQWGRGTLDNYGFIVRNTHTDREFEENAVDDVMVAFFAREYSDSTKRPRLVITYKVPAAKSAFFM